MSTWYIGGLNLEQPQFEFQRSSKGSGYVRPRKQSKTTVSPLSQVTSWPLNGNESLKIEVQCRNHWSYSTLKSQQLHNRSSLCFWILAPYYYHQVTVQNGMETTDGEQESAEKILFDLSKSVICVQEVSDKSTDNKVDEASAENSATSETTSDSLKSVDMVYF